MTEAHASADLGTLIRNHPIFAGLAPAYLDLIAACASPVHFARGDFLMREGEPSDALYLLRTGHVALQTHVPGRPALTFQTTGPGDLVGVSWLVAPYRCLHDALATGPVEAIRLDAVRLRAEADRDPHFGYQMMKRFLPVLIARLHATRLQLLDIYGHHPA